MRLFGTFLMVLTDRLSGLAKSMLGKSTWYCTGCQVSWSEKGWGKREFALCPKCGGHETYKTVKQSEARGMAEPLDPLYDAFITNAECTKEQEAAIEARMIKVGAQTVAMASEFFPEIMQSLRHMKPVEYCEIFNQLCQRLEKALVSAPAQDSIAAKAATLFSRILSSEDPFFKHLVEDELRNHIHRDLPLLRKFMNPVAKGRLADIIWFQA